MLLSTRSLPLILRGNWAADPRVTHELPIRAAIRIVHLPVGGFHFSYVKEKTSLPSCVFREFVFLLHCRPPDKVQAICREQERGARLMIRNFLANLLHFIRAGIGSYLVIQRVCVRRQTHVIGARNEYIICQTLGRATEFQPWNDSNGRELYIVQI